MSLLRVSRFRDLQAKDRESVKLGVATQHYILIIFRSTYNGIERSRTLRLFVTNTYQYIYIYMKIMELDPASIVAKLKPAMAIYWSDHLRSTVISQKRK